MSKKLLKINSSGRVNGSVTRELTEDVVKLLQTKDDYEVIERDVAKGLPFVNETIINGFYTPVENQTEDQKNQLRISDELVQEFKDADVLVFGFPIYNFGIPASLKAYIDLVGRVGHTFKYTENGPVALLPSRKTYLVVASGGTPVGSGWDYATNYFKHVLGFLGIREDDIELIAADTLNKEKDKLVKAKEAIAELL